MSANVKSVLSEVAGSFLSDIVAGLIFKATASHGKDKGAIKEMVKQSLPHIMGIGKADEAIWARLIELLEVSELEILTEILETMTPHQRNQFCLTIAKVSPGGDEKNVVVFTAEDGRVKVLKKIVSCAKGGTGTQQDVQQTLKMLKAHRLVPEEEKSTVENIDDRILGLIGLSSWDEVTDTHIAKRLEGVAEAIEAFRKERQDRGFFNSLMKKLKLKEVSNGINQSSC